MGSVYVCNKYTSANYMNKDQSIEKTHHQNDRGDDLLKVSAHLYMHKMLISL